MLHKNFILIPKDISLVLERQGLQVLYEVRAFLDDLISDRECRSEHKDTPGSRSMSRRVLEEKQSGSVTYRLEMVSCGKHCNGCPHGPYWYGYWKEGGKTRSKYIGKRFKKQ